VSVKTDLEAFNKNQDKDLGKIGHNRNSGTWWVGIEAQTAIQY